MSYVSAITNIGDSEVYARALRKFSYPRVCSEGVNISVG